MRRCRQCSGSLEAGFRFCPWCGLPQRSKLVEFFHAHPLVPGDHGKALRVSRYAGPSEEERHVRLSVWNEQGRAEAAVSLEDAEAARLARFVLASLGRRLAGGARAEGLAVRLGRHLRAARLARGEQAEGAPGCAGTSRRRSRPSVRP